MTDWQQGDEVQHKMCHLPVFTSYLDIQLFGAEYLHHIVSSTYSTVMYTSCNHLRHNFRLPCVDHWHTHYSLDSLALRFDMKEASMRSLNDKILYCIPMCSLGMHFHVPESMS